MRDEFELRFNTYEVYAVVLAIDFDSTLIVRNDKSGSRYTLVSDGRAIHPGFCRGRLLNRHTCMVFDP